METFEGLMHRNSDIKGQWRNAEQSSSRGVMETSQRLSGRQVVDEGGEGRLEKVVMVVQSGKVVRRNTLPQSVTREVM